MYPDSSNDSGSRQTHLVYHPLVPSVGDPFGPELERGDRGGLEASGHRDSSLDSKCVLFLGSHRSGAFTYLDGQNPYGESSSQVDVGFEGVEDHCVTALGGKDQR